MICPSLPVHTRLNANIEHLGAQILVRYVGYISIPPVKKGPITAKATTEHSKLNGGH